MKKRHPIRSAIFALLVLILCAVVTVGAFFGIKGYNMYQEAMAVLPLSERIEEIQNEAHFTRISQLPDFYIDAVVSVEDHRFWDHCGIDPIAIARAVWTDLKTMSFQEGGSTITQQLVKNMLFTQDKKLERKFAEVFAAFAVEKQCSKEEIFELYVNTAYFGSNYYGIYEAAAGYFGKLPSELTDYEAAMLAGLPNAPSVYSPDANAVLAEQRLNQVLRSMVKHEYISQEEANHIGSSHNSDET